MAKDLIFSGGFVMVITVAGQLIKENTTQFVVTVPGVTW
jgi:formate/nitrite transporter FocA (FNT family)